MWKFHDIFYHSDFMWNQFWGMENCQICPFYTFCRHWIFIFVNFCIFSGLKCTKSKALIIAKMAFFELVHSAKLISHKNMNFPHCVWETLKCMIWQKCCKEIVDTITCKMYFWKICNIYLLKVGPKGTNKFMPKSNVFVDLLVCWKCISLQKCKIIANTVKLVYIF